jgi:hypothetical protein
MGIGNHAKHGIDGGPRPVVRVRPEMAVGVERLGSARVPQPGLDGLHRFAVSDEQTRVEVPQGVQRHPAEAGPLHRRRHTRSEKAVRRIGAPSSVVKTNSSVGRVERWKASASTTTWGSGDGGVQVINRASATRDRLSLLGRCPPVPWILAPSGRDRETAQGLLAP